MARKAKATNDGLAGIAEAIQRRREEILDELARMDRLLAALTPPSGGGRRGKGPGRPKVSRKSRRGRGGARLPKKGTLGGKILVALADGPKGNADLLAAIRLPEKKRSQLSVNLNNLKKRGFVESPSRGTWRATAAGKV